ncbi:uncharacterized protein [Onthophagus taurus]|uniref:uncharacterized protein n=1 Tax=Onthophagus taurus TaxID=166361 RepID=UPI0039BE5797
MLQPFLKRFEKKALRSIKEKSEIVVLPADKGNATVVMDRKEYDDKMMNLLDPAYRKIKKDLTDKIVRKMKELIKTTGIPAEQQKGVFVQAPIPPRIYGLPKIHKPDVPLRPIVKIAKILSPFTGNTESYVRDSTHFVESVKGVKLDAGDMLVSFDVESLFTRVPVKDAVEGLRRKLIPEGLPEYVPDLVEYCLSSTYFSWKGEFYEQFEEAAMGSPLSPVIANFYMELFEEDALKKSQWKPKLWLRYVDDTFVIWQHGQKRLQEFLDHLNSQHPMIKFTMETETAKKLPFLDVLVTRTTNGDIELGVYRKKTHTNRYLQACSHHHPQQKRSVIRTLFQRAARLCEGENLKKEQHFLRGVLQKNGYTSRDINQAIKQRKQKEDTVSTKLLGFICLRYVSGVTERIARHLKKNDIVVRYGTVSKIRNTLPIAKDKLTPLKGAGVYRLSCSCGKVYVGQTGRNVECRIKEHERDVRLKKTQQSAVAEHCHAKGHRIDFEQTKVLARDNRYYQRLTREAIEIHRHKNNVNREDGWELSRTWKMVVNTKTSSRLTPDASQLVIN